MVLIFTPRWANCPPCADYMDRRAAVLLPAVTEISDGTEADQLRILDGYLAGVHHRHLEGKPL